MGDRLWGTNLFEERLKALYVKSNFDAVCVDESDNLLVDTAANGARLSFPAPISYDWIYAPILSFVKLKFQPNNLIHEIESLIPELRDFICQKVNPENQLLCRSCSSIPDEKMKIWLRSAYHALYELKENHQYIIKTKRSSKGKIESRKIQIADIQTGRISENSRWSKGIHEFVEVKHDITVQQESLTSISLSHAVFYGFYKTITALTGTAETFQTQNIYNIKTFHVPPHKPLIRKDLPCIFAENTEAYYQLIVENAKDYMKLKRPLLILCETIHDSLLLEEQMRNSGIFCQLLNEIQEEEEHLIISRAGIPGKVTIATNAAGRGTDIILDLESEQNGGLHVLLTFYPCSEREEQQAIGRSGRQGQPGTSQMIINKQSVLKTLQLDDSVDSSTIAELLRERRIRIAWQQSIQHLKRARLERHLFSKIQFFFDAFRIWIKQMHRKEFLDEKSHGLCKIQLTEEKKNEIIFSNLTNQELAFASECKRLLSEKTEPLSWKIFLENVIEHMKHKVITEWSLQFFQPIQEKIEQLALSENDLKEEIEEIFNAYFQKWEKYLEPNGRGISAYLEELTTLKLYSLFIS